MKLSEGYYTQKYKNEQLMVAGGAASRKFRGLARANETAAFLIDQLKTGVSEEGLVAVLCEEYDVDEDTATADVCAILDKLRSIGAIEE